MLRGTLTDAEISDFERDCAKCYYPSNFAHIMATRGIRPAQLHGLMGTTGSGKSTLAKSIIAEVSEYTTTLIWLSEETVKEYQSGIKRAAILLGLDYKKCLANLRFIEEKNLDEFFVKNQSDMFQMFEDMIIESECQVVFIDNMSTSNFYSDEIKVAGQNKTSVFMSKITKKLNVAIFYLIHTSKPIHDNMDRLITKEDVRGSQKLPIMSEYFYVFQKFTVNEQVFPIIRIDKHRHHRVKNKFYLLGYDKEAYRFDKQIEFEELNKIFLKRDRLGKRSK